MTPDLRLYAWAGGVWLAALLCLAVPAGTGALLAVVAAAALAALWVLRRARRRPAGPGRAELWAAVATALLAGVVCGAAVTAARVATRDAPALHRLASERAVVHAELAVSDDPRPLAGAPGQYLIPTRTRWIDAGHQRVTAHVRLLVLGADRSWASLLPGTVVQVDGRLAAARGGDLTAAVLTVAGAPRVTGAAPWSQRAAGSLRSGLVRACAPLPAGPRGLLPGLVVGDTSRLPAEVADEFRATGLTHLVAVSGANAS